MDPAQCLAFLAHAREDNTFDDALFLEALTACAHRKSLDVAEAIVSDISAESPKLRADDRFFHVIAELVEQFEGDRDEDVLEKWLALQVVSPEEHQKVLAARDALKAAAAKASEGAGKLELHTVSLIGD